MKFLVLLLGYREGKPGGPSSQVLLQRGEDWSQVEERDDVKEITEGLPLSCVKMGRRRMERGRETEVGTRGASPEFSLSSGAGRLRHRGSTEAPDSRRAAVGARSEAESCAEALQASVEQLSAAQQGC